MVQIITKTEIFVIFSASIELNSLEIKQLGVHSFWKISVFNKTTTLLALSYYNDVPLSGYLVAKIHQDSQTGFYCLGYIVHYHWNVHKKKTDAKEGISTNNKKKLLHQCVSVHLLLPIIRDITDMRKDAVVQTLEMMSIEEMFCQNYHVFPHSRVVSRINFTNLWKYH